MKAIESVSVKRKIAATVDWEWVQRNVAASEPPRLTDIPAHIKFLQKWGWGENQRFMLHTLRCLEVAMPAGRIVSGPFIERLATLKFPPSEMIPLMVHACLIAQAIGDKHRDNVACSLTDGHIKSMQARNKVACASANAMLINALDICESHIELSGGTKGIRIYSTMANELVKFIFELDDTHQSLDAISHLFVQQFAGEERPPIVTDTDESSPPANIVIFDSAGSNNTGSITVHSAGFKIDSIIERKKGGALDEQYIITYINEDGSVGTSRIKSDGTTADDAHIDVVTMDSILSEWRMSRARIELLEGYPANKASTSQVIVESVRSSAAIMALQSLDNGKFKEFEFRCQKKPTQRVFVEEKAANGKLRLIPMTPRIGKAVTSPHAVNIDIVVDGRKMQLQRYVDAKCVAEFWLMRTTTDTKFATMVMRDFTVNVRVRDGVEFVVTVPCAVNCKSLCIGEELVLLKPQPKAALKGKSCASMAEPLAKKAKVDM